MTRCSRQKSPRRGRAIAVFVAVFALAALPGCSRPGGGDGTSTRDGGASVESGADGAWAVERSATKGPLTAVVRASVDELTIADTLTLRIDFDAREDCDPKLPGVDELPIAPAFRVEDYRTQRPRLDPDGRLRSAAIFELEPLRTGEQELGPFAFEFTLEGDEPAEDGGEKTYPLEVEALPVVVASLTESASAALDIRPLADPIDPAEVADTAPFPARWIAIVAAAVVALAAVVFLLVRRSRRTEPEREVERATPREAALAALAELERRGLAAEGRVREFYFEMSRILREFIEGEFGLRAAEETTEEFLDELTRDARFSGETKALLTRFLEHCDLVKFAKYAPSEDEVRETGRVAREFVERSAAASATPATPATSAAAADLVEAGAGDEREAER